MSERKLSFMKLSLVACLLSITKCILEKGMVVAGEDSERSSKIVSSNGK